MLEKKRIAKIAILLSNITISHQDHRFTRSSQYGQLRPNIPSCHDLENRTSETSERFSLGE